MEYKRKYLCYGSNMNLEQMVYRCPQSKVVGTAMLKDYELEFRGVATIVPKKGAEVPVLIWEIGQFDEIALDRYEGFPNLYGKELFNVEVNGETMECMAYTMNGGSIAPPSSSYYNTIKSGYEANGFDTSYLRAALERSVEFKQSSKIEIFDKDSEIDIIEESDLFDEDFYSWDNIF